MLPFPEGPDAHGHCLFIVAFSDIKVDVAALTAHRVGVVQGETVSFEKDRVDALGAQEVDCI